MTDVTPTAAEVSGTRGIGPFTGRQLTVIIVSLLVVLGIPVGAFAITGSNIFVTDHTSGAHASVDNNGNLATANVPHGGSAMLAGTASSGGQDCTMFAVPAGKAFVITAVHMAPLGATTSSVITSDVIIGTGAGCAGPTLVVDEGTYSSDNPSNLNLDPGITVATGHHISLGVPGGAGMMFVEVFGYYEPSSICAVSGANCY